MLIQKPNIVPGTLSDSSHITDMYDQLSDGLHETNSAVFFVDSLSANSISAQGFRSSIVDLKVAGALTTFYINSTMEANGYLASDYKNSILLVFQASQSRPTQLVQSIQVATND